MVLDCTRRVGALGVDSLENLEDLFVGPAVERALERADGGGDGGVHIGKRGGGDARGEGGGVQFMIGVQDERDVKGALGGFGGSGAVQLEQKIRGVRERAVGLTSGLPWRTRS